MSLTAPRRAGKGYYLSEAAEQKGERMNEPLPLIHSEAQIQSCLLYCNNATQTPHASRAFLAGTAGTGRRASGRALARLQSCTLKRPCRAPDISRANCAWLM